MHAEWKSLVKEWRSPRSGPAVSGVRGKMGLCDAFAPRVPGKFTGTRRKADCPRSICPPPDDWLTSTSLLPGVREPTLSSRLGTWHPPRLGLCRETQTRRVRLYSQGNMPSSAFASSLQNRRENSVFCSCFTSMRGWLCHRKRWSAAGRPQIRGTQATTLPVRPR